MTVLGAVLTLAADPAARAGVLTALGDDPRVTVGELQGARLPVVLELRSREEERAYWSALESLPGVLFVDLAYAGFPDPHGSDPSDEV